MKKGTRWIIGILVFLAIVGLIFWLYTSGRLNKLLVSLGLTPVISGGKRTFCNDTGDNPEGRSIAREAESCLPPLSPKLYLVFRGDKGDVIERKFTTSQLKEKGILDIVEPSDNRTRDNNVGFNYWTSKGNVKIWFNQKRLGNNPQNANYDSSFPITEDEYLFVDNISYPNIKNI